MSDEEFTASSLLNYAMDIVLRIKFMRAHVHRPKRNIQKRIKKLIVR